MQHIHISAKHALFDLKLREVWRNRGLVWLFAKRSFVVTYKQTILGPAWLFLAPLLTSAAYVVLFGNIAKLGTDGVPQLLFYLSGTAMWTFFSTCVTRCANTFTANAPLFGKVYFPRLTVPLSDALGSALHFCIQMLMVLAMLAYYAARGMVAPSPSALLVVPLVLLQLGVLGTGVGIVISSLTTKYRDLQVLVTFGMNLWMYATPVVYPLSTADGTLRRILLLNPVTEAMELYRAALLGAGTVLPGWVVCSVLVTAAVALLGIVIFNKVERTFMDTV